MVYEYLETSIHLTRTGLTTPSADQPILSALRFNMTTKLACVLHICLSLCTVKSYVKVITIFFIIYIIVSSLTKNI